MNSLRGISRKINAIILLVIAGLALSLAMAWNYYQTRKTTEVEEESYAAELLSHGLPAQAAEIIEASIQRQPVSSRSLKMRKVLADIYMNELNDYEKAMSELVFIKSYSPEIASSTEESIRYCMQRLGRVYDIERRKMLDKGVNPVLNTVATGTAIRIGNQAAVSVETLKQKMTQLGVPENRINKQIVDAVVQTLAQEIILTRAADRAGVKKTSSYIEKVKQFEKNLGMQQYLETEVFKGIDISQSEIQDYITSHPAEFGSSARVAYSEYAFNTSQEAEKYLAAKFPGDFPDTASPILTASGPLAVQPADVVPDEVITENANVPTENLPSAIAGINWGKNQSHKYFGPVKIEQKWHVFIIKGFAPAQKMPQQQALQIAQQKVMEQKQHEALTRKFSELAQKEGLKINNDVIEQAFFKNASDSAEVKEQK